MDIKTKPLIVFSERHTHFAITFVDIVHSTDIVAHLTGRKSDFLYATFLNTLAQVVQGYGAVVVKTLGDGMLYYFPESDFGNENTFDNVIACGHAVIAAREKINQIFSENDLVPISYRVSASYGPVSVAENQNGDISDLFGSTVNTCVKMNKLAEPDTMIVGEALYEEAKADSSCEFQPWKELILDEHLKFPTYLAIRK